MKFLVIGKMKDSAALVPPATIRPLMEMTMAAFDQQKKAGTLLEAYVTPTNCPIVILDYKSVEEWINDQNAMPILSYYNYEIYPLADMQESMKGILEALKMAERMMPK